ncbi:MAG: phosphoglucosamine mutase [Gammaproteobacteria bacterium]|nr:phosphoglucosamine mutase [Gammaproteobacteria bacterium]
MGDRPVDFQLFGTDGIRGRVGVPPITPDLCLKLGWVIGREVKQRNGQYVLVGKDTRISGYLLESLFEAGLIAAGVDVGLLGPFPTPAVAILTRNSNADLGVVISASHNSYEDNGFKFFDQNGRKLSDAHESKIADSMNLPISTVSAEELGRAKRPANTREQYIDFCKSTVSSDLDLTNTKIVLDCANGACYSLAPTVFREFGAEVFSIGTRPNGFNINDRCGSTSLKAMQEEVRKRKADIGFAFDGDGDRVIAIAPDGEVLDGDRILFGLAKVQQQKGTLRGGVVGTDMSNLGLERSLQALGIPFSRAAVGDRHVSMKLAELGWSLGGETSGHVLCHRSTTTGDGIVSALQVVQASWECQQPFAELVAEMEQFPQVLLNVPANNPELVVAHPKVAKRVKEVDRGHDDTYRVLVRPSGTEPVVRIMVEGPDATLVTREAEALATFIQSV